MVDLSDEIEWVLLIACIVVACVAAFALTARAVGGWRQLQTQLNSPNLPTRYLVLIVPATAGATALVDPLDMLAGTSWVQGLLTFLALFAGSYWCLRRSFRSTGRGPDGDHEVATRHRARQRRLALTSGASALLLAVVGIVILVDGNARGGWTALAASAGVLLLLATGFGLSRRR